jgi:hypothetical protein
MPNLTRAALAALFVMFIFPAAGHAQSGPGAYADVSGGTLRISQDPGVSGSLVVTYHPPRADFPRAIYTVQMMNIGGGPPGGPVPPTRTSTCTSAFGSPSVSCDAAGITSIAIDAGDGNDEIGAGALNFVNSGGSAPLPVPVNAALGDGNDVIYFRVAGQAVNVDGGAGDDGISAGAPYPYAGDIVRSARVSGGEGDDRMEVFRGTTETTFLGGQGNDTAEGVSGGATTLDGEAGDDTFAVRHAAGTLRLLGGDGGDTFTLDDLDSARSARTEVRAGSGDDEIGPRTDGGRDLIDCGAGSDSITAPEDFPRRRLLRSTYVDCPIVAVWLRRARLSSGPQATARVAGAVGRAKARVTIRRLDRRGRVVFKSRAVRVRLAPGRPARLAVPLPKAWQRLARTRLEVTVRATSTSGDRASLKENAVFER